MREKNNLVSQYLENISRKALEEYQTVIKKYVRHRHGVYALYRKNKLYYVGLASNLRTRLRHHLGDRHAKAWDSFSVYLTVGGEHLRELETLLLRIIDRKGNKQRGKFGRAEDLRKKLWHDFKKAMNSELGEIFSKNNIIENKKLKNRTETTKRRKGRVSTLAPFTNLGLLDEIQSPLMPPKRKFQVELSVRKIKRGRPSICDDIEV